MYCTHIASLYKVYYTIDLFDVLQKMLQTVTHCDSAGVSE